MSDSKKNYSKRIVSGFGVVLIGIVLSVGISYLIRIFLARNLSLHEFGLFYAVYTFIVFLSFFRDLGLNQALVKFIPEFQVRKEFEKIKSSISIVFMLQLLLAVFLVAVLFFIAPWLSVAYFKDPMSLVVIRLFSFMLLLLVLDDMLKKIFLGFQKMHLFSFMELGKNTIVFLLIVLFASFGMGLKTPVVAYLLASPLIFFIFLPFFFNMFPFFKYTVHITRELTKKLVLFGLPAVFNGLGDKILSYMDVLLLIYFVSLEQVGIYSAVIPTALLFLFFSRAITLVLFPLSSELWAKNESRRLSEIIGYIHKFLMALILPVMILLFVFADMFILLLFGEGFVSGALALRIIIVGMVFYNIAKINFSVLLGAGIPAKVTKILFFASIVNLVLNIILIPEYGIAGAAIGTSISYFAAFILSTVSLNKLIKTSFSMLQLSGLLLLGIVTFAFTSFFRYVLALPEVQELVVVSLVSLVFYTVMLFLCRIIKPGELKNLIKLFSVKQMFK